MSSTETTPVKSTAATPQTSPASSKPPVIELDLWDSDVIQLPTTEDNVHTQPTNGITSEPAFESTSAPSQQSTKNDVIDLISSDEEDEAPKPQAHKPLVPKPLAPKPTARVVPPTVPAQPPQASTTNAPRSSKPPAQPLPSKSTTTKAPRITKDVPVPTSTPALVPTAPISTTPASTPTTTASKPTKEKIAKETTTTTTATKEKASAPGTKGTPKITNFFLKRTNTDEDLQKHTEADDLQKLTNYFQGKTKTPTQQRNNNNSNDANSISPANNNIKTPSPATKNNNKTPSPAANNNNSTVNTHTNIPKTNDSSSKKDKGKQKAPPTIKPTSTSPWSVLLKAMPSEINAMLREDCGGNTPQLR